MRNLKLQKLYKPIISLFKLRSSVFGSRCLFKFLEILTSNKTSTYQSFKFPAQAIFNVFQNTDTPGFETFEYENFFIYSTPYK